MDQPIKSLAWQPGGILGPLKDGHYVQVGMGVGFYVPEADFQTVQRLANETGKVQFLSVDRLGRPLRGSREELLANPECAGVIAWITPGA
ncbi:MAG TPA: hypothetical protein VFE27_24195 [Acidobacteriaceae bacterium]|jgi:hypothetical protein|nr:hypothetical protein [Acidobacteriaceae bacterium]